MTTRCISRRDLLKVAGSGAALGPIIAACGGSKSSSPAGGGGGAPNATAASIAPVSSGGAGGMEPPGTAVNIDFWNPFTGGDGPYLRGIVDAFNKETQNVKVKFQTQKDLYGALHAAKA